MMACQSTVTGGIGRCLGRLAEEKGTQTVGIQPVHPHSRAGTTLPLKGTNKP